MTGKELAQYRKKSRRTQVQAARDLGVSQTYLSLLESGKRELNNSLVRKAVHKFGVPPTEMPPKYGLYDLRTVSDSKLAADLAALGYEAFSYLKPARLKNPAEVLLSALHAENREARLVEALPWVALHYVTMDWPMLIKAAKANDLQNRLGYVVNLAHHVARNHGTTKAAETLLHWERVLEPSRLLRLDTLMNDSMTNAEKRYLTANRSREARNWRVLTNLRPEHLNYYVA